MTAIIDNCEFQKVHPKPTIVTFPEIWKVQSTPDRILNSMVSLARLQPVSTTTYNLSSRLNGALPLHAVMHMVIIIHAHVPVGPIWGSFRKTHVACISSASDYQLLRVSHQGTITAKCGEPGAFWEVKRHVTTLITSPLCLLLLFRRFSTIYYVLFLMSRLTTQQKNAPTYTGAFAKKVYPHTFDGCRRRSLDAGRILSR